MSFQYANQGSLRQLICDDNTMFPWPVRLGMAQDIADGMSYLHRLRIVHRDLTSLVSVKSPPTNTLPHPAVFHEQVHGFGIQINGKMRSASDSISTKYPMYL